MNLLQIEAILETLNQDAEKNAELIAFYAKMRDDLADEIDRVCRQRLIQIDSYSKLLH